MSRDFASLTPQETLLAAITIEERNGRLYRNYAEMFEELSDPDSQQVAQAFREMAEEEDRHGAQLRASYLERYEKQLCLLTPSEIADAIEFPRLEDGDIYSIGRMRVGTISRVNALRVALAAEEHARRFYQRLAESASDPPMARLYAELAQFETGHIVFLDQKLRGSSHLTNAG
ncbi:MAG TPA: ferritin family protein [Terriglobales bacterium]|nr:ferritin family protein [Terriglobales bacterium]